MSETNPNVVLKELSAAFERDPWINTHKHRLTIKVEEGALILDGSVENIAAKRRALALAQQLIGDQLPIIDLLRRVPTVPMENLELRDAVAKRLSTEPVFKDYSLRMEVGGEVEVLHDAGADAYEILANVNNGVITLTGSVGSLTHQRIAEALVWWVDGCEVVNNQLRISPPEQDSDNEITDVVRMLLEKDPLVHADQLRVGTAGGVVHLDGSVTSEVEKNFAVLDAFCVRGVWDVLDRIDVQT